MIDLQALALRRAEEMNAAGRWRRRDPDEGTVIVRALTCEVCGSVYERNPRGAKSKADICAPCGRAGWRSRRCTSCDGPIRTYDYRDGVCAKCKATDSAEAA